MPGDELFADFISASECKPGDIDVNTLLNCVIVYRDNMPVGRSCLYVNSDLHHDGMPVLVFGNFDCINDTAVSSALFGYIEQVAKDKNLQFMIGPMNGSTWNDYRLPITGERSTFTGDLDQPLYYSALLSNAGYTMMHRYYSSVAPIHITEAPCEDTIPVLASEGVTIRGIDVDNYTEELKKIYELCATAFAQNVLFSPIDEATFVNRYLPFRNIITSDLVLLAEQDSEIIAVFFAYPDVQALPEKRVVIKTMARNPHKKVKDLVSTMIKILHKNAVNLKYNEMVHAFMHEENRSRELSLQYEGMVIREYALFIKEVAIE